MKNIVVIAYGNPSRGDDAVGPAIYRSLLETQDKGLLPQSVTLVTDFQLQIEHVTDFELAEAVIFVDAATGLQQAFSFEPIKASINHGYSTHILEPQKLLGVFEAVFKRKAPSAYLLAVGTHSFELGESLSPVAVENTLKAEEFITKWIHDYSVQTGHFDSEIFESG